jgi:hypothetical protein
MVANMESDLTRNETLIEDGHTYTETDARADLAKVHNVYRDVMNALVRSCVTNHILLTKHEIEVVMEGVGEALANEADRPLEHLPNESYKPDDAERLLEKAHTSMVDALKIKDLDWPAVFEHMFRPQATRGMAPQNPATLAAKEQL